MMNVGAGLMVGAAVELLTPIPKQPDWQAKDGKPNYWFNGAQQTSAQGLPIPIGTGTMLIGGTVISAGVSVEDIGTGSLPTNSPYSYSRRTRAFFLEYPCSHEKASSAPRAAAVAASIPGRVA
ncbi:Phage-related protein, tail component [Chromobacterium violaceum]|uniref:Phage-related protein, tail component n=1 Tax=Chromobacterium violaceum TaxID=536 RepID=A0A447TDR2_CHRVL|nr:Phage-related protein, tail component [Chromobacterium violaceum]